jgi:hypothetical protein
MPLAIGLQKKVRRAVEDFPLGPRDVRGIPGHRDVFISLKGAHNGHAPAGAVDIGKGILVNVFQLQST